MIKIKRMIRNITLTLILPFTLTVNAWAEGNPARWTAKDHDTTLYLLGTIHVLKPEMKWQSPAMLEDFDKSDGIFFELSQEDIQPQTLQPLMFSLGMFPPGQNLGSLLEQEEYARLVQELQPLGVPSNFINQLKPWLAGLMLAQAAIQKEGYSGEIGVEKTLMARASKQGKKVQGLETAAQQLGHLSTLPMSKQVNFLKVSIRDLDDSSSQLEELLTAWADGNIAKTASLINEGMDEMPEVYNQLIVARNIKWINKINQIMNKPGTYFIAVGAGHMPGEDGIISLLGKEGYKVTRIE